MNKESRPIYPPQEGSEFENYIAKTPFSEDCWEEIQEAEMNSSSKKKQVKNRNDYSMEMGEEITFENLMDDDFINESQVDIDSIIKNMDMSDHNYRDNIW